VFRLMLLLSLLLARLTLVFRRAEVIRTRMGEIRTELDELEQADDDTDASEEDVTRSTELLDEWDTLAEELEPLEEHEQRLDGVRSRMLDGANRETGFGGGAPELVRRKASDPFKDLDLDQVRSGSLGDTEIRSRAAAAVEVLAGGGDRQLTDEHAKAATALLDVERRGDDQNLQGIAAHVLLTGNPAYRTAFREYLRDPIAYAMRAALSLTPANGGFLVPFTLDPTIILTNAGSMNPYRQVSTVKQTTTNDANYVTSAGVNAAWLAEGVEAADSSPTVGTLKITPQKASAWVFGTYEVLEDSDFAQQFPTLMSDAKDRLEEQAFAAGTGTGQPKGIQVAATVTVPSTAATGLAPLLADYYSTQGALPARWRGPQARLAWMANLVQINRTRNLPKFTGGTESLVDDTQFPPRKLGSPILESTSFPTGTAAATKVEVFGDFSQFYIVDRIGMSVLYEPMVKGATQRPTGQAGWFAFWRVSSDVTTPQAFRALVTV
jgi:HK97 family phage major capsid protein